jgi:hypothetical protein
MKKIITILMLLGIVLGMQMPAFAEEAVSPMPAAVPVAAVTAPAPTPDPSGANTGGAGDVVGVTAGAPSADDMKKMAQQSRSR